MFQVRDITSLTKEWDAFLVSQKNTIFVQSSLYGKFYESMHEHFFILGIYRDARIVGGSLVVTTHARRGNFLFLPYGPVLPEEGREEACSVIVQELRTRAGKYACIRISPFLDDTKDTRDMFHRAGFRLAPMHTLAETTWLLHLAPQEESLLSSMNKNHRNLIHRCEKAGVTIVMDTSEQALEDLQRLLDETAKRHHFVRFSRAYINHEFQTFSTSGHAMVVRAFLPDGRLDAAAIIIQYGTMACYRHSASLNLNPKLPTSYLLQWRVIQHAKKSGMHWYNFWGIAPPRAKATHPFHGITHFKRGFHGEIKTLVPAMDLPTSPRYAFLRLVETIRKIKRGF